jgi:hypothetical protein
MTREKVKETATPIEQASTICPSKIRKSYHIIMIEVPLRLRARAHDHYVGLIQPRSIDIFTLQDTANVLGDDLVARVAILGG